MVLPACPRMMLALLLLAGGLAGCGGPEVAEPAAAQIASAPLPATMVNSVSASRAMAAAASRLTVEASANRSPLAPVGSDNSITSIALDSTGSAEQLNVPLTFGQVFAPGHVPAGQSLVLRTADGASLPLQVDVKARHADGSLRHAILSSIIARLATGATQTAALFATPAGASASAATPAALLTAGFTAAAHVDLDGVRYSASADALLRSGHYTSWLSGPVANEWHVAAPLTTAAGLAHPHLSARFAIRAYAGQSRTRVDVTIENSWAFEAAPQNFTYDATVEVGGSTVYTKSALTHYHHARWRKLFWWGAAPQLHLKHNTAYLIDSKALPNYDRTLVVPEASLAGFKTVWTGARTEPMGVGLANPYMLSTGGRADIGLLPGWAASYLLSMDKRAWDVTVGTADLAGSWSIHYRDKKTGRPVSLADYPYMTMLGTPGDTFNPATRSYEAFPNCASSTACSKLAVQDTSHQPGFSFLPYLVTGDFYHLEELQFWAMYNSFVDNPEYREYGKGLFKADQVRGQAWSMRTLAQAAYITPDSDAFKSHFATLLANNLDYYNATYSNNPTANALGILTNGYAITYNGSTGIAPWMDDFFTSAIGYTVDLGFAKARPLLAWKSKFAILRMIGLGSCWIEASTYALKVRDSSTSALYTSIGQAYKASHTAEFAALPCASTQMASALGLRQGEMVGYSDTGIGYPSNMQPALAYAVGTDGISGIAAWDQFMQRSVKPDYSIAPQFAIVPR